ncbi:hypothetical protein L3Q82_017161 [Scortum barcoo]|uniref:Uncharacterized protein n=1 Tax=Scortum barcoo TaxID=214431 RepID=A0ACB8VKB4_9TELE|nr:hypothetical protein L3Q82_017161 [Scortum barcoo]
MCEGITAPHSYEPHLQQQKVRARRTLPERDAPSAPNCRRLALDSGICHLRRLPARVHADICCVGAGGRLSQHNNRQTAKQCPERSPTTCCPVSLQAIRAEPDSPAETQTGSNR